MKKKFASIVIVALIMLDVMLGAYAVGGVLNVNLGTITVTTLASNDVITSATLGSATGTVSGNTVSFTKSSMVQGTNETLTVNIENTGGTASNITGITVSGNGSVISIDDANVYPVAVAVGATVALTFTVVAVTAGSVTPSIAINWT